MASSLRHPEYKTIIGGLIRARKSRGMSQATLADALNKPQSFIAKIEGCERRVDILEYIMIARVLKVSPSTLLS